MVVYSIKLRKKGAPKQGRVRRMKCNVCGATGKEDVEGPPRKRPPKVTCTKLVQTRISQKKKKADNGIMTIHVATVSQKGNEKMLVSIHSLAEFCGIDWQTARDWAEFGYAPRPLFVGGCARWRQSDLDLWLVSGCPQGEPLTEKEADAVTIALLTELESNKERS